MKGYIKARMGRAGKVVHWFSGGNVPVCGSGDTHNVNNRIYRRVYPVLGGEVTCKKCLAIEAARLNREND